MRPAAHDRRRLQPDAGSGGRNGRGGGAPQPVFTASTPTTTAPRRAKWGPERRWAKYSTDSASRPTRSIGWTRLRRRSSCCATSARDTNTPPSSTRTRSTPRTSTTWPTNFRRRITWSSGSTTTTRCRCAATARSTRCAARRKSAVINSSLWGAIMEQDLPYALAAELEDIYQWTVDFFGIQKGDSFTVIYDERFHRRLGVGRHRARLGREILPGRQGVLRHSVPPERQDPILGGGRREPASRCSKPC